jgi:signal transduction histidine kinase
MAFAELVHELRQPLSSISGFARWSAPPPLGAPGGVDEGEPRPVRAHGGDAGADRRFLRPDPGEEQTDPGTPRERGLEVAQALREAAALCPRMPPGVQLQVQLPPDLGKAVGEAQPFVQVVLNLLANARDAKAAKGPGTVLLGAERQGERVVVTVADEGAGIPPDFTEKLFEPFATTKGEAGTGLGLYICQELLAPWGAEIALLSPPPRPYVTAFAVRLRALPPASQARGPPPAGWRPCAARSRRGSRRSPSPGTCWWWTTSRACAAC